MRWLIFDILVIFRMATIHIGNGYQLGVSFPAVFAGVVSTNLKGFFGLQQESRRWPSIPISREKITMAYWWFLTTEIAEYFNLTLTCLFIICMIMCTKTIKILCLALYTCFGIICIHIIINNSIYSVYVFVFVGRL